MKTILIIFTAAFIFLLGCSDNKELSKEEAMSLIKKEMNYPKIVDHDIYCGDPEFAKKMIDAGLEKQGLVTIQYTRKLSDADKPIIEFSDKAQPHLLPSPEKDQTVNIQKVILAEELLQVVTSIKIMNDGKSAVADYTTTYSNVTPFSVLVHNDFKKANTHQVNFALYDDGWRLEK